MSYVTCKELIDFLDDYVAGDLPPARAELFERHLTRCRSCFAYVHSYRETIRLARAATRPSIETVPPELLALLLRNTTP